MLNAIERNVRKQLEPVEVALSKPSDDMWDVVFDTYRRVLKAAEQTYTDKAKSEYSWDALTDFGSDEALESLRARAWVALRRKLEEQTSEATLLGTLRGAFEERFRYEAGVPRVWKPSDDLEGVFTEARDKTLALLPLYATIAPTETPSVPTLDEDDDPSLTLISPAKLFTLESRFKREADAAYVEAKRSMVSSVAQIPVWMYIALAVLGWNEAMAILFNPLYFALLLVAAASA
jgi:hypothetical protein